MKKGVSRLVGGHDALRACALWCLCSLRMHRDLSLTLWQYIDSQRKLSSYFTHPDVEGVYESKVGPVLSLGPNTTQVPLLWRAVCELGCVARVRRNAVQPKSAAMDFEIAQLEFKTTAECEYLTSTPLNTIYLFQRYAR